MIRSSGLEGQSTAPSSASIVLATAIGAACAILASWHRQGLPPYSIGYVNLVAMGLVLPGMLLAAPVGARFAQTADVKRMRLVVALFIAIAGARFLFDAFR